MSRWSLRPLGLALLCGVLGACGEPSEAPDDPSDDVIPEEDLLSGEEPKADLILGRPTRYPIILVHGFAGSTARITFHQRIVDALCNDGHQVHLASVPPFEPAEVRGAALATQIDAVLQGRSPSACAGRAVRPVNKVNLIAHSMGGLDSRYAISGLGYGGKVASLLTMSTPHRGSAITDLALGLLGGVNDAALNAFADYVGRTVSASEIARDSHLKAALLSLSERNAPTFNAANRDDARVYYQSWAGLSNVAGLPNPLDRGACEDKMLGFKLGGLRHVMHIALKPIAAVVAHGSELIPNDALVRIDSAKWGDFRGCIPADHADEVGAFGNFSWSAFQYVDFFRLRAYELQRRGF